MKRFKVEYISNIRKAAYVLVRCVGDFEFEIMDGSTLGPLDLKAVINQPRALKENGSLDLSLFALYPKDRGKLELISVGDVLELKE